MSTTAARGLARAAAVIAVLTVLARLAGFARTAVFGRSVGTGCVGSVYQTANTIPNIVFDIVAGGMLSALVVPILAPVLATGRSDDASRIISALLTWALVVLVPLAAIVAALSGPIVRVLLGSGGCPGAVSLGTRMLAVFSVQIVFYGVGVVLAGALTAGERFTWPALAPLLSSLAVIASYLWYGALAGTGRAAAGLPRSAEWVLTLGTTAGVVVLALCQLPAVWRTGVRWRPTMRFPAGVAPTVRRAALAGAFTLAAQQIAAAVMIRLANSGSPVGTLVIVVLAQTVFLLPWAVLSLPVATTSFPRLAAAWDAGERDDYRARLAVASRVVIALAAGGTALLVAVATPARVVLLGRHAQSVQQFTPAIATFAIGLLGWSVVALLSRALYAAHAMGAAAAAQVAGQVVVIIADVMLSAALPAELRAAALGLGNSIGVLVAGALLVVVAVRRGALRLPGVLKDAGPATAAAVVAAGAGWLVGKGTGHSGVLVAAGMGVLAAVVAAAVFLAVLLVLDRAAVRDLRARVVRR